MINEGSESKAASTRPSAHKLIKAVKTACAVLLGSAFALSVAVHAESESGGIFFGGGDSESGSVANEWGIGSESGGVSPSLWGVGSESSGASQEWGSRSESGGPLDSGAASESGGVPARVWGSGAESDSGGVTTWGSQRPVG